MQVHEGESPIGGTRGRPRNEEHWLDELDWVLGRKAIQLSKGVGHFVENGLEER